jgi:hypothetical protein
MLILYYYCIGALYSLNKLAYVVIIVTQKGFKCFQFVTFDLFRDLVSLLVVNCEVVNFRNMDSLIIIYY